MPEASDAAGSVTPPHVDTQAVRRGVLRSLATLIALLVIYYALPVGELPSQATTAVLSSVGLLTGVVALTWLAAVQIRHQMKAGDAANVRVQSLLAVVYLAIVVFAIGYYAMATSTDDQLVDLETKTDALYFTMTTLATVGYGDVHASGQAARAIVTVQIAFNLVVIGTLASVVSTRLRQRAAGESADS